VFPPGIFCKLSSPPRPSPLTRSVASVLVSERATGWANSEGNRPLDLRLVRLLPPLLHSHVTQISITPLSVASGCRTPRHRRAPAPRGLYWATQKTGEEAWQRQPPTSPGIHDACGHAHRAPTQSNTTEGQGTGQRH
jgi:hypothetical protein